MKLSISLNKSKAAAPAAAPIKRPAAFSLADEPEDDADISELVAKNKGGGPIRNLEPSKAVKRKLEAEKLVDDTVYQYDEVYDKMQEAKLKQQALKEVDSTSKKPKYIGNLLAAAATRKLDHLRAEEKMMQREREAEGDMYKDKESFVTQAYKDQMEEVRKAEEEEKNREELRKKQGKMSTGLTHFYRQLLDDSEQQHEAAVAATQKRVIGPSAPPSVNLTITKPPSYQKLTDLELAERAREEGKEVEVNDDGEIVDKRELLSAGLNLSLPNTRRLGLQAAANQKASDETPQVHRAVGVAASRKEINERRTREIRQQLEDETKRQEKEKQEAEERATQRVVVKRNTENDVESARARYLERRKRQKLEEEAAASMDTT